MTAAVARAADPHRALLFADWMRSYRASARIDEATLARHLCGLSVASRRHRRVILISGSYIAAIERAVFDPLHVPPDIMTVMIDMIGPLPDGIDYPIQSPAGSPPGSDGDPDGAGDGVPVPRSPAPEGPDGPERDPDVDDERLPLLSIVDGAIALQPFPDRALIRVLLPDQAARIGQRLIEMAGTARSQGE